MGSRFRVALLLPALLACREEAPPAAPVLRPGASLFDQLERLEVARFPATNLPAELRELAAETFHTRSQTLAPEAWRKVGDAPDRPGEFLWKARTQVRLDLELGRPWLTHDGRACTTFNLTPRRLAQPGAISGWKDPAGGFTVGWSGRDGGLVAASSAPPREVRFGWEPDAEHDGRALEPGLLEGRLPTDGRALARALEFDHVARSVLVAGTPARLVTRITLDGVDELRLAVARWDVGFEEHEHALLRVPSTSDGMVFRVLADGEVLWSLAVREANVFHEASIDVARLQGRTVELALETDPGPGGDARFDYGLWSGLTFHGAARRAPERPHIVLVDVDTLRADRLGCYGYERETTPRIDRWATRAAIVYDDAVAQASWTLPSTVSIVTGLAPCQHGVHSGRRTMGPELEPIAERLRAAGYETQGRSDGAYVSAPFGFGRGFDVFDARARPREEHERIGWQPELARIRARRSERPLFLFLQTYMVHGPYVLDRRFEDPSRPYRGRFMDANPGHLELVGKLDTLDAADWRWLNDTYDAGIRRMDDVVGAFLEGLDEAFGGDPYLVIVTSDHGEELGDHGGFGHGHALHEELLRTPLLVRFPGGPAGVREARPVSNLDLVPTILDWAGLATPATLAGRSLRGPLPERRLRVAELAGTAYAAYLDGWKLTYGSIESYRGPSPFARLVRLGEDPREAVDLLGTESERAQELGQVLTRFLAEHPAVGAPSGEAAPDGTLLEELHDLGYVGDE